MGLAQREIEQAGMTTVTISPIALFTASVGAPRVCALEYPNGLGIGNPGNSAVQRDILRAVLEATRSITAPGEIKHLSFRYEGATVRSTAPSPPPPIAQYLKTHPWHVPKLIYRRPPSMS